MNTPFGQDDPLEGFPSNYVKVKESHVWEDETNSLVDGSEKEGERVGTGKYAGYYDYAIDAGFNKEAIPNQGSALFLHCIPEWGQFRLCSDSKREDGGGYEAVRYIRRRRLLYCPGSQRKVRTYL